MTSPHDKGRTRRLLDRGWHFRQADAADWLPARVPGCNFSDLLAAGLIEDPLAGDAEDRLQWIEQADWEYRCTFTVTPEELAADAVDLVFDGLDTLCAVTLNGDPLLDADNMFRRYRCPVRDRLRVGENRLALRFRSPVRAGTERQAAEGLLYPAENDKTDAHASVYVRKAPYHFGWDWGPKYVTSGVWQPVWLDTARTARIADLHYRIDALADDLARLTVEVEVEAFADGEAVVAVACDRPGVAAMRVPVTLVAGEGARTHRVAVTIAAPRRWWPNGLGEPFLYPLAVSLCDDAGTIDAATIRAGLRTVAVRHEPDAIGECFEVIVNGRPVFMKGANYIPPDSFLDRMTPDRYRRLFRDAADANMNMLRVWGGGTYESDLFHDLADEHGILIWQDFMFSCTLYPSDPAFLANVEQEAREAVRRVRRHPSLALWCGNNEVSMGIAHWDWPAKFDYPPDTYRALVEGNRTLFEGLLPAVVSALDPERFYMPSSPIGFWEDPADDARGDGHYWGVWHGELPFSTYAERVPRFMSEYGFQSYPAPASIARFVPPAARRVGSHPLAVHQKHARGDAIIGRFVREHYGEPRDFDAFCRLSQLVQADGLRVAFEAHRRAMPRCMGSLYWQLNDCWPSISWSGIDYYGRWKALHYQAARSFAPVILSAAAATGDWLIHLVSDLPDELAGTLLVELVDLAGRRRHAETVAVTAAGNRARLVHRLAAATLAAAGDPRNLVLHARLAAADGRAVARTITMLVDPAACALPDPGLSVSVVGDAVTVRAERFARAVLLEIADADADAGMADNFVDNVFDLLPGEARTVTLRDGATIGGRRVTVSSLVDLVRRDRPAAARRVGRSG